MYIIQLHNGQYYKGVDVTSLQAYLTTNQEEAYVFNDKVEAWCLSDGLCGLFGFVANIIDLRRGF